jgi:hypothetical protein
MFIAQFADGTTVKERLHEGDTEGVYWDDLPDKPITALHLTLPGFVSLTPPVVTLSNYTRYYFANQARADIFSLQGGGIAGVGNGQGTLTHQIIAGVDDEHDFVLYIEVDRKANVQIKRFSVSQFTVTPEALKQGKI